jgi:hypothetical protein
MELLFDITGNDIAKLNDEDLRTLVGLLCEAEFHRANHPVNAVTWGGNQNASDGGLDVVINKSGPPLSIDFIPRNFTGYQVKKANIQPAQISKEMKPKGRLRNSIKNLIKQKGAYIIASSGSTSASALLKRTKAMRHAVSSQTNHQNLLVDFFDSSRLASWVRKHPSLILWLRNKTDRQLKGWQPFGNWSGNNATPNEHYIFDEKLRLRNAADGERIELDSSAALINFRTLLSTHGVSLRLTGLSGVGKTRFVQALFETIGENPLNSALAIYTDMSDGPSPDPKTLAEQLIAQGARAILIVDNCPPDLHRRLTTTCKATCSNISLLTIEYDVRDDLPEDTDVFILEPSSDEVIEKLITNRFSKIGQVNARTVTTMAGGNARVAIALAATVKIGEAISSLRDNELFKRLFKQRNSESDNLLKSAEACSLVYSFDGVKIQSDDSELKFLGHLIDIESPNLYRDVRVLKERGLVQCRGIWRAVLPHAIANRLAKQALESIPIERILNLFNQSGTQRLFKSFSRRLSYLHDSPEAVEIVTRWLKPDGFLGTTNGFLNHFGMSILENIAPVAPQKVIEFCENATTANEQFTSRENSKYYQIVSLLRLIAYEQKFFNRSVKIICQFALSEKPGENTNSIRRELGRLFQLYLSGTHASIDQRSQVISELLKSSSDAEQNLGIFLLGKAISTGSFFGMDYGFGARPRDYGWRPKTNMDTFEWYQNYIELCASHAINGKNRIQARKLLADNVRGLWRQGLGKVLKDVSIKIHNSSPWNEGWVAVKSIFLYDKEHYDENILNDLKELEGLLRPRHLLDQAKTIALTSRHDIFDFDIDIQRDKLHDNLESMNQKAKEIGGFVAQDLEVFKILLPELLSTQNQRLFIFGKGFGDACQDLDSSWKIISLKIKTISPEKRDYGFLLGFLHSYSIRDPESFQILMNSLVSHVDFAGSFPFIQANFIIDLVGMNRLKESLNFGVADIKAYGNLPHAHFDENVTDDQFIDLLNNFLGKINGIFIVIECLYSSIKWDLNSHRKASPLIIQYSGKILSDFNFSGSPEATIDYQLADIAKECFKENEIYAKQTCRNLKDSIQNYPFSYEYPELAQALATTQPKAFLDIFVGESNSAEDVNVVDDQRKNLLNLIPPSEIIDWCNANKNQIPTILNHLEPYTISTVTGKPPEWKPVVISLLKIATDLNEALKSLLMSLELFPFDSWGIVLNQRLTLLKETENNENKIIRDWAIAAQVALEERAKSFSETESRRQRPKNETFE